MTTVNGYTAERMQEIEDEVIVSAALVGDNLVLTRHDGTIVDLGSVRGPQGIQGIQGPAGADGVSPTFGGYKEPVNDLGNVAGAVAINLATHNVWRINPTAAVTISFTNPPSAGNSSPVTLIVANSTYAITWPAGTKFPNGAAPQLSGETWLSIVVLSTGAVVGASWPGVA